MSGKDHDKDSGRLLRFPKIFMPGSLDAPEPAPGPNAADAAEDEGTTPAGSWPRLPSVGEMGPPLALTMPGIPAPDPDDEEGEFAPPAPEDPDNPTVRDTAAVAMALMTAMGVAAAQGMWHRARRRQALADQARAAADKATAKAAGAAHHSGGRGGGPKGAGASTGFRHEGGSRRRRKRSRDSDDGSHGRDSRKRGKDKAPKAPKATADGRTAPDTARTKHGKNKRDRDSRGRDRGGLGDRSCVQTRERRPDGKAGKDRSSKSDKDGTSKSGKGDTSKGGAGTPTQPRHAMTWKAPRKSRPGPGGDRALLPGRKRWKRTVPDAAKPGPKRSKSKPSSKRSRKSPSRWTWTSNPAWLKHWRSRKTAAGSTSSAGSRHAGSKAGGSWAGSPPPPPGAEWMRPPPGADRTVRVTVERVDEPRQESPAPALAGAPAAGRIALPAGLGVSAPASSAGQWEGARFVSMPAATNTQYDDAELTIFDVIDADADMAEEITEGVGEARSAADGCDRLFTKLEALHAKIVELRVPGVLEGMVVRLMEKSLTVKAKAEAIAEGLPRAAEAIAVAGANAAARHKPLADAVRDAGHRRPAERDYHND